MKDLDNNDMKDLDNDTKEDILKRATVIQVCLDQVDRKSDDFQRKMSTARTVLMGLFEPAELMVALMILTNSYSKALIHAAEEEANPPADDLVSEIPSDQPMVISAGLPFAAGLKNGKIPEC